MKSLLRSAKIYLVLDAQVGNYHRLFEILKKSVAAGVEVVQLRDKVGTSRDILNFSKEIQKYLRGRIPFIINDRIDVACAAQADGVHLGQDDLPLDAARKILGKKAIVGISCQTMAHAMDAQEAGADYIGFGSVFKTLTKPGRREMDLKLLSKVVSTMEIPVFAIGGIDLKNVYRLREVGVNRIAVTRAISLAKDIRSTVQEFRKIIAL